MLPLPVIPEARVEPIEGGRIPQGGAGAWLATRSDGRRLHAGVDIAATLTTPIRAPESGTVRVVGDAARPADVARGDRHSNPPGWVGYGPRLVLVEGDSGWWHLLAHVHEPHVRVGDRVTAGQHVATGSALHHLHWEVRRAARPPAGWAVVEAVVHPGRWLAGTVVVYEGQCPPAPGDSTQTPRACRPGRGAAGGGGSIPR